MINQLIASYGVFLIAAGVALECLAIPLVPGEAELTTRICFEG